MDILKRCCVESGICKIKHVGKSKAKIELKRHLQMSSAPDLCLGWRRAENNTIQVMRLQSSFPTTNPCSILTAHLESALWCNTTPLVGNTGNLQSCLPSLPVTGKLAKIQDWYPSDRARGSAGRQVRRGAARTKSWCSATPPVSARGNHWTALWTLQQIHCQLNWPVLHATLYVNYRLPFYLYPTTSSAGKAQQAKDNHILHALLIAK